MSLGHGSMSRSESLFTFLLGITCYTVLLCSEEKAEILRTSKRVYPVFMEDILWPQISSSCRFLLVFRKKKNIGFWNSFYKCDVSLRGRAVKCWVALGDVHASFYVSSWMLVTLDTIQCDWYFCVRSPALVQFRTSPKKPFDSHFGIYIFIIHKGHLQYCEDLKVFE